MEKIYTVSNIIIASKHDDVFIKIQARHDTLEELSSYFTFHAPNYQFDPRYRKKQWDGMTRIFDKRGNRLYIGLLPSLQEFATQFGYILKIDPKLTKQNHVPMEKVVRFMDEYVQPYIVSKDGVPVFPHDYQYKSLHKVIQDKRCLLLCPTGSGKSLIAYSAIRYMQSRGDMRKILLIVPTTALVEQMYSDFREYSTNTNWEVEENCHRIHQLYSKDADKQVYISTWQSIYEMPRDYFEQFSGVFVDECFSPDTLVLTPKGYVEIKDIKTGDKIINYNEVNGVYKEDIVVDVYVNMKKSSEDKMIEIVMDDNSIIRVTENHKFLTTDGWVTASDLTENHEIINIGT